MGPNTTKNKSGIFTRSTFDMKRDLKFLKLTAATSLNVQNREMLVAVTEKVLIHYTDDKDERPQEMTLPLQPPDHVAQIHLCPSGFHAIVSSKLGHNFYVDLRKNSTHHIKKIRCVVTSVGWNPEYAKETEMGPILLGTVQGSIIELHVESGLAMVCKELTQQVSQFADQRLTTTPSIAAAVSDIRLFPLLDDDTKCRKWIAVIAQMSRIIVLSAELTGDKPIVKTGGFTSSASLQAGLMNLASEQAPLTVFHPFFSSATTAIHTISASKFSEKFRNQGFLTMYPTISEPKRYAWASPDGVSIGRVDINAERVQDIIVEEFNIEHRMIEGRLEPPTGIALTEYHILLAYSTRVLALSLLPPHEVVFEDLWNGEVGNAIGFVTDTVTDSFWLYTNVIAMKYGTNDEGRFIWKTYLDKGDYAQALKIARSRMSIEPDALEMVFKKQADFYIQEKNFTAAAEILAQSSEPFESVVLKFLTNSSERKMGLKTLLDKKLDRLNRPEDKIRRDALVMWLLNVQLEELAEMRRVKSNNNDASFANKVKDTTDHVQRYFMRKNVIESIQTNREAVYRMCVAHADFEMQLFFANAVKDIRTVIDILMLREQYIEVLDVLKHHRVSELTYEMFPLLIERIPKQVFGYLFHNQDQISPQKLTPSLSLCIKNMEMAIPAIKYLEMMFKSNNEKNLHNIYIHLMAKFRPERLMQYLEEHGTIRSGIPYELDFAMRTCEQFKLDRCVVFLYCVAEMFSDAVEKALVVDVELAKQCALMMDDAEANFAYLGDLDFGGTGTNYIRQKLDEKTKKIIWLKIASYYVTHENSVEKCIAMIKESNNLITIQDLLPIIPKFTKIGDLKHVIVDFLNRNKARLETLEKSMQEATDIASEIRDKQEKLKNRTTVVRPTDVCAHCLRPIAGKAFNVHSCRHLFHRECVELAMTPFLTKDKTDQLRKLIADEERILGQMRAEQAAGNRSAFLEKQERYQRVAGFISHIVGSECPLCGSIAISQIDKEFLSDQEYAADLNSWLL